jgi:uncharacterized membrane protein
LGNNIRDRFKNFRRRGSQAEQLQQVQTDLLAESTLDSAYIILITSSCAIATLGLLSNSAAVIIGAMIIAPLMLPIRGLAFGALQADITLFRKGIIAVAVGTLLAVAIAFTLGLLGATLLYLTNLLGIALSCMVTFVVAGYTSMARARQPLIWTMALTAILLIPLGVSFARLVRQAQLETSLRRALLNRTVTFGRLQLLNSNTNWLTNPPEVRLSVRAREPVTPRQVELLEEFIKQEMGQPFTLIFEVGQVEEIRRSKPR